MKLEEIMQLTHVDCLDVTIETPDGQMDHLRTANPDFMQSFMDSEVEKIDPYVESTANNYNPEEKSISIEAKILVYTRSKHY